MAFQPLTMPLTTGSATIPVAISLGEAVLLAARLLFCIGIQVLWNGARELLLELLRATA